MLTMNRKHLQALLPPSHFRTDVQGPKQAEVLKNHQLGYAPTVRRQQWG